MYKPAKNPYILIGMEDEDGSGPPELDIAGYPAKSGGQVDYVLMWCYDRQYHREKADLSLLKQLDRGYSLCHTSPKKLMKIYKLDPKGQKAADGQKTDE